MTLTWQRTWKTSSINFFPAAATTSHCVLTYGQSLTPNQSEPTVKSNGKSTTSAANETDSAAASPASKNSPLREWSPRALTDEQQCAAKALLQDHGSLRVLTGHAGAGKSTALAAVKEGLEKEGYQVLGGAIAGATTQDLASKTGIESRT